LGAHDLRVSVHNAGSYERPAAGSLARIAYRHLLVAYDGTSEGDEAVVAADLLAERDGAKLTVAVVVQLERLPRVVRRFPSGTQVWNDVLLDRARADLERAKGLVQTPAEFTVLLGPPARALAEGAEEYHCDAIMLPSPPRGPARLLSRDPAAALRRRTSCEVLRPR
jgi:nucleotide-binding universal stress UspA family protein